MWRALLSNFNESLLLFKTNRSLTSCSSSPSPQSDLLLLPPPTRKQHIAVASSLSENEGASEILMKARKYFCTELSWDESLKHFYSHHHQSTSVACSLSSFLAGSLVLHESNEKRWFNALKILNTMMVMEPWALRENFVRRIAIEIANDNQMRLDLAKKFVEMENLRQTNEQNHANKNNDAMVQLSPCDLLSAGFRHAIASRISISLKKNNNHHNGNFESTNYASSSSSKAFWQQAIEFMTSVPAKSKELEFPYRPSEFSNYLVACNSADGMWKAALNQIPLHYERALFSSGADNFQNIADVKIKEDDYFEKVEKSWDPGARVSRFHCFQWMCATYSSIPANRRPHEVPKPLQKMAQHLLHPCCFENWSDSNNNNNFRNNHHHKCIHFSSLKEHAVIKSVGEISEVENSNPNKFDSGQACCNLVLMMQRSCSWVGATKLLHEFLHMKSNTNKHSVSPFAPTLLHYNTCIDSNSGWQVCLQQLCRMRSHLGPTNAKKSWLRYVENYNSKFRKFANPRDPNFKSTGDVFKAHESQIWLRIGRSLERQPAPQHLRPHDKYQRRIGAFRNSDEYPPLEIIQKFVEVAPESVQNHPMFADFRTKQFVMEETELPKVKMAEKKKGGN